MKSGIGIPPKRISKNCRFDLFNDTLADFAGTRLLTVAAISNIYSSIEES